MNLAVFPESSWRNFSLFSIFIGKRKIYSVKINMLTLFDSFPLKRFVISQKWRWTCLWSSKMFSTMEHHKNWGMEGWVLIFFQTLCKTKFKAIIFNNLFRLPQGISFPTQFFKKKSHKNRQVILVWQFRGFLSTVFKFGFGSAVLQTRYSNHTNKGNVTDREWGIFSGSNLTVSLTANICLQMPAHIPRVLGFVNIVWWWHTENYESVPLSTPKTLWRTFHSFRLWSAGFGGSIWVS